MDMQELDGMAAILEAECAEHAAVLRSLTAARNTLEVSAALGADEPGLPEARERVAAAQRYRVALMRELADTYAATLEAVAA